MKSIIPLFLLTAICFSSCADNKTEDQKNSNQDIEQVQVKEEAVSYQIDTTTFGGYVAYDENKEGKRPVVLVVHEWWGLDDYVRGRAKQLAEMGYLAMAVDMFGSGKTADNPGDAEKLATPFYMDPKLAKTRLDAAFAKAKEYTHAGIRSEIIHGYARTGMSNQHKFRSNHSWNAVMIDSAWHLLDATWASGYFMYGSNEFVSHYSSQYFLSDPNDFINDHYPEDLQWTLLPHPPTLKEFQKSPFKYGAFVKFKIQSYKPAEGIIEVMHGDSIHIELETGVKEKKLYVTAGIDSLGQFFDQENSAKINGQKISYTYKVSPASGEWLNVVYNGEPILRYKLLLKNRSLAETTLKFKINE